MQSVRGDQNHKEIFLFFNFEYIHVLYNKRNSHYPYNSNSLYALIKHDPL